MFRRDLLFVLSSVSLGANETATDIPAWVAPDNPRPLTAAIENPDCRQ